MVESAESRKDYTIEIFTKKGELIHEESMKVGDIKVNISGEGFCDGVIKISLTAPEFPSNVEPGTMLNNDTQNEAADSFKSGIEAALTALLMGDVAAAQKERERALRYIVNDDRLFGCLSPQQRVIGESRESVILNAILLLYSGDSAAADDELGKIDLTGDFDAIYLKARCCEAMGCWNEVKRLYTVLLRMYISSDAEQRQDQRFWKLLYRLSVLNEKQFHDPGIGVMRDLTLASRTEECFVALRDMLRCHPEYIASYQDDELFNMMIDKNVDNGLFLQHLRTTKILDPLIWDSFLQVIRSLILPYPWDKDKPE